MSKCVPVDTFLLRVKLSQRKRKDTENSPSNTAPTHRRKDVRVFKRMWSIINVGSVFKSVPVDTLLLKEKLSQRKRKDTKYGSHIQRTRQPFFQNNVVIS